MWRFVHSHNALTLVTLSMHYSHYNLHMSLNFMQLSSYFHMTVTPSSSLSTESSTSSNNNDSIGPIVGGVVCAILVVLVVIVIVVIVIVIVMRWFHTCTNTHTHTQTSIFPCRRNGTDSKYVEENELQPTALHFTKQDENVEAKYEEIKR